MQGAGVATDEKPYERTSETITEERETVSHCVIAECGLNGDKMTPSQSAKLASVITLLSLPLSEISAGY